MAGEWGDVYPHETLISHIRRLLDTEFPCQTLSETPQQFRGRVQRVEDFLNSPGFAAPNGRGLLGLAMALRPRCKDVILRQGERLAK